MLFVLCVRKFNFLFAADEVLKANMDLEKVQQELAAKVEKHDAIQNEVIFDFLLHFQDYKFHGSLYLFTFYHRVIFFAIFPNEKLCQVKSLKLDMEGAGSDNQVKDLEQKLAAKQSEVDEALYRMQRWVFRHSEILLG